MIESKQKEEIPNETNEIQEEQSSREGSSFDDDIAGDFDSIATGLEDAFNILKDEGGFQDNSDRESEESDEIVVCGENTASLFRKYWEQNVDINNEYLQAIFGPSCPIIHKLAQSTSKSFPPQTLINEDDVHGLYVRMLEFRQLGRYREAYQALRPTLPYYQSNHLVWTRMAEICIFELYEETFDFEDMYRRIFCGKMRTSYPSHRKQTNEIRPRHPQLGPRFAHIASVTAFTLCKFAKSPITCLAATQNHAYLMLKLRKYRESLDASNYFLKSTNIKTKEEDRMKTSTDQIEHIQLFKAEAKYYLGKYDRAIEYCHQVQKNAECDRLKMRAEMILAMSYLKKGNIRLAYQYVLNLVTKYRLDDMMVENVAQFGISIAHKMSNNKMLKAFLKLLQDAVI